MRHNIVAYFTQQRHNWLVKFYIDIKLVIIIITKRTPKQNGKAVNCAYFFSHCTQFINRIIIAGVIALINHLKIAQACYFIHRTLFLFISLEMVRSAHRSNATAVAALEE